MRLKEEANDYRYFPDPDLLPVEISASLLEQAKADLPELPEQKKIRFIKEIGLSEYDAEILTSQKSLADYFEALITNHKENPKLCVNWIIGELLYYLNKEQIEINQSPISAQDLSILIARIVDQTISGKIAKDVFKEMWLNKGSADEIIAIKGLKQITNENEINNIVDEIIANNPSQFDQLKSGNEKIIGFFVGQVMKATKGKANPKKVNQILREKLDLSKQ
jgi:aspartyl-tRNA(Asn)/glutamyl-tRNA(Gln) amidotransferase subunit B